MKFHYSLDSALVLDTVQGPGTLAALKQAGVSTIWLWGFFFGKLWSPIEDMVQAAEVLRRNDFEVGVIQLPVGHPGNGLNPDDDTLDLQLPAHWRYRIDHLGNPVYYCADLDESMVRDNVESVEALRQAGFTQIFMDDDLRSGVWGSRLGGCFCSHCVEEFNLLQQDLGVGPGVGGGLGLGLGLSVSREAIVEALESGTRSQLTEAWIDYNCSKVTRFMEATSLPGIEAGIMVMHLGDEHQGIDISAIKNRLPQCMFRVGEYHFNDTDFGTPEGKASELFSILFHLDAMGREYAFSETTVFPARALSHANLIYKVKLELAAGIPNILFMSGTWLITEDYWQALAAELPALQQLEQEIAAYERSYPVHLVYGTYGHNEVVQPYFLPLLAGLPAKPVKARDRNRDSEAECLLFFGGYELTPEWEQQFTSYKRIIMDQTAFERNKHKLENMNTNTSMTSLEIWDYQLGSSPKKEEIVLLQELLAGETTTYPLLKAGSDITLLWLPESESVILLNLKDEPNRGTLSYRGGSREVVLGPLDVIQVRLK
ncbi:hypothetical protein [Paenibacillus eucommiae]|uniref:Uncharacterized protein n=1 Tax=Paenibacillus eucommiae TaxID=1355755 RepID=A0ABS4IU62_9BACL|nr:hypothetical protein [Paenibacillus eucommiae]MBP1991048.1 hypothetical protein [Paenibacillus eucommiae]